MTKLFVVTGNAGNIPARFLRERLDAAREGQRLVVIDDAGELATLHGRGRIDPVLDLRRGNWDFFADHRTALGFANAVDALLPRDADEPWRDEGKRLVMSELLRRVAATPRPHLSDLHAADEALQKENILEVANMDHGDLDEQDAEKLRTSLRHLLFWQFGSLARRDIELPMVSIAGWFGQDPRSVLFVNGANGLKTPETLLPALTTALRDHAALSGLAIEAVSFADVASALRAAA